ncbi:MAG: hypothetical protein FJ011_00205 [Chloroflexi bacterium]|nr:hypothetical protein [Chloroflexota bacterium]
MATAGVLQVGGHGAAGRVGFVIGGGLENGRVIREDRVVDYREAVNLQTNLKAPIRGVSAYG